MAEDSPRPSRACKRFVCLVLVPAVGMALMVGSVVAFTLGCGVWPLLTGAFGFMVFAAGWIAGLQEGQGPE